MKKITSNALESKFGKLSIFITLMSAQTILDLSYVAIRGQDEEEGSVQRLLNSRRIKSIKDFILEGNTFFNTFVLNWNNRDHKINFSNGKIEIPVIKHSAQIIDGQHRLAGLREAIEKNKSIGKQKNIVVICNNLNTKDAAKIFVNINSEQKPVPKSLIYDLFGEIEDNQDHAINRANDIATELNENQESPYFGFIKFPGKLKGSGIDLSSVIQALKKHLEIDGTFQKYNLKSLQYQKIVIFNFLKAIKSFYDKEGAWENKTQNPFLTSAGFIGSIDFLMDNLLARCSEKKNFTLEFFKEILNLNPSELLYRKDLKNLEGKSQRKVVAEFLGKFLSESLPQQDEYEF